MILLLLLGILVIGKTDAAKYQQRYFDQYLDHFNFLTYGNQTFKQRYLVNDSWWQPRKGPIFFYTGNEGNIEAFWNNTGFVFDIAPKFQALVVFAEHRYYGLSLPFGKSSFKQPNLSLLSIEQVLIDYVTLIKAIKEELNASLCPVIAFGGSYGGMLSAYMRFKYPNVINGAIAASAPIIQTAGLSSTEKFFQAVTKDFNDVTPKCKDTVMKAYTQIEQWFAEGLQGYKKISNTFSLCHEIKNSEDYTHFLKWTRLAFVQAAMMDYPYAASFMSSFPAYPVKVMCKKLITATSPPKGLADAVSLAYNTSKTLKCFNIWEEFIDCADPTGCGTGTDSISWDYQCCTEVNLDYDSKEGDDMFPYLPFTAASRNEYCQKKYGVVPRRDWMKLHMWGKDIGQTRNIVFSNGDLDPWAAGGVLYNVSSSVVSIMIKGGAHHLDLRGKNPADPVSVQLARKFEENMIAKWIKESN